jgi:hypothetical protein
VAYISTTKRQDSTLQLFLDECAAAGLAVEEISKDPVEWQKGWVCGAGCGACRQSRNDRKQKCQEGVRVEIDKGPRYGGAEVDVVGAMGCRHAVVFQELPALQEGEGRERYVLHRVRRLCGGN